MNLWDHLKIMDNIFKIIDKENNQLNYNEEIIFVINLINLLQNKIN
jgi:hypothetical protein